jgi:hypothetical protein
MNESLLGHSKGADSELKRAQDAGKKVFYSIYDIPQKGVTP